MTMPQCDITHTIDVTLKYCLWESQQQRQQLEKGSLIPFEQIQNLVSLSRAFEFKSDKNHFSCVQSIFLHVDVLFFLLAVGVIRNGRVARFATIRGRNRRT